MWAKDCYPERPWWVRTGGTFTRADGIGIYSQWTLENRGGDPRGLWDGKEPYEDAMARIDAAHPLPAPPPMPGQVWCWAYDVCGEPAKAPYESIVTHVSFNEFVRFDTDMTMMKHWPQPNTILVYGPSQYGANIPWSPA